MTVTLRESSDTWNRRVLHRVGLASISGLLVWAPLGPPTIVFASTGPPPSHANVVLVLGPPVADRVAVAERLLKTGAVGAAPV